MDPGTGLTLLGGALGSVKVVEKILGPTADYLGAGMRDWDRAEGQECWESLRER